MQLNKLCIYPFARDSFPVIEHMELFSDIFTIDALVSPNGWGLKNTLFEYRNKNLTKFLEVKSSFAEVEADFNTIFVPDFDATERFTDIVIENVSAILSKVCKVIWRARITDGQAKKLITACALAGCELDIKMGAEVPDSSLVLDHDLMDGELYEFGVPIVAVVGSWQNTDKFKVSIALRQKLLENGYRVSQIGSRNYCELLGFHSFPGFMFNAEIGEAMKVLCFNRYVKQILVAEKPDILLITMPGAFESYNAKITNGFGILPYLAFKAVTVDFLLFTLFYSYLGNNYFKVISDSCKYKFGCEVDCFHMANTFIDISASLEKKKVIMSTVSREMAVTMLEKYAEMETPYIPVLNLYEKHCIDELYGIIIQKLSNESAKVII